MRASHFISLSNEVESKAWAQIAYTNKFAMAYYEKKGTILGRASLSTG